LPMLSILHDTNYMGREPAISAVNKIYLFIFNLLCYGGISQGGQADSPADVSIPDEMLVVPFCF
jgi:hypothetical protein